MSQFLNYSHSIDDTCGWENRYRPQSLEDVLLPAKEKRILLSFRDKQKASALFFWGAAGTGKTTTGLLLNPDATIHLNASNMDYNFVSSPEFQGMLSSLPVTSTYRNRRQVVLLDEADALTERVQQYLRPILEEFSTYSWFVFVVNDKSRIIEPLRSRMFEMGFGFYDEEMNDLMVGRCMEILEKEKRIMKESEVREIVRDYEPDMRQILIQLQARSS